MYKKIIIFVTLILFLSMFIPTVNSASGDVVLTDWDDIATGLNDGTSMNIVFNGMTGTSSFKTDNVNYFSSPNSFYTYISNGVPLEGWWNLTSPYNYIGSFSLWYKYHYVTSASCKTTITFVNNSVEVIKLQFTANNLNYWDVGTGWETIDTTIDNQERFLRITHNSTNQMYVEILSESLVLENGYSFASAVGANWVTFDSIHIEGTYSSGGNQVWIDNLNVSTTSEEETSTEYADISGYNAFCSGGLGIYCNPTWTVVTRNIFGWETGYDLYTPQYIEHQFPFYWSGTIKAVDIPISNDQYNQVSSSLANYYLYVNGVPFGNPSAIIPSGEGGNYLIRWISTGGVTLTNEKPLFSVKSNSYVTYNALNYYWYGIGCTSSPVGSTKGHNTESYYMNNQFDGNGLEETHLSMCYYFQGNDTITIDPHNDTIWNGFGDDYGNPLYGDTFIEWANPETPCNQRVGQHPKIMFNLSSGYLEDDSPYYRYWIYKSGTSHLVAGGLIGVFDDYLRGEREVEDYTFTETGYYYIILFNTTEFGTEINATIDTSLNIYVCPAEGVTPTIVGVTFDFSDIPVLFKVIISLFIIIVLTVTPYFVASMVNRGRVQIEMPDLVYVAFFFIGVVASIMLDFLEIWVLFVILVGLIITYAILHLQKKGIGGGGE